MALEDKWAELSDDQKARAKACKTPEDVLSFAEEEGFALSENELEAIAGGSWDCVSDCSEYGNCSEYILHPFS